jgi:hypothetical protein
VEPKKLVQRESSRMFIFEIPASVLLAILTKTPCGFPQCLIQVPGQSPKLEDRPGCHSSGYEEFYLLGYKFL